MKKNFFGILFFIGFFLISPLVQAYGGLTNGILISSNFSTLNQTTQTTYTDSVSKSKLSHSILDAKIGWITEDGWYIGGIYHSRSQADIFNTDKSTNSGVSLGLTFPEGFFILGHYFLDGKFKDDSASSEYSKSTGLGAEAGFLFDVSTSFYLGASYSYREFEYKKRSPTQATFVKQKFTENSPMLVFALLF